MWKLRLELESKVLIFQALEIRYQAAYRGLRRKSHQNLQLSELMCQDASLRVTPFAQYLPKHSLQPMLVLFLIRVSWPIQPFHTCDGKEKGTIVPLTRVIVNTTESALISCLRCNYVVARQPQGYWQRREATFVAF